MPLDTRIALTGQPLQLESPLAQYSQLMSVVNAGNQNQLAQMQMSAAQRAMLEEEGTQNYLADPTNDLTTAKGQQGLLRFGKSGQAVLKSLSEQRKLQTEEDKSKYEFEVKTLDRAINDLTNLTDLPSAFAAIDRQIAAKSITPQQGAELKTRINNAPDFSTWQNQTITGMLDAKERLGAMAEQRYQEFRGRPAPAAPAAPAAVVPTAPINATEAPLVRPTQAAVPLDKLTVSEDARGDKTYYLDGVPIPGEKFAELTAASIAPAPLSGTRAAFLASMAPASAAAAPMAPAAMAPAAAAAPASAAAPMAPAAVPAPAAPPDMANALALKIQGLQDQRNQLEPFLRSSSAKLKYEDLGKQIDNLSKGFSVSAGGAYTIPGVGTFERPPTASEFEQLLANSGMTDAQKIAARAARVKKESTFAPPMQITMPVAVEDPNRPGSVIYVDRAQAVGKTPATAIEGLAPKEIQAREAKYPQALQAVKTLETKTESLAKDIEVLANHPGLTGISGLIYGRTPAVTKDARAAQALYDSIVARGGFAELQSMRAASPTGGALGNVSNQEGQYLRDAWAAINRTQDTEDLKANLLKAAAQARASKASIKEAFDATYDYRANRGGGAAPAAAVPSGRGVDTNNPLLK